MRISEEYPAGSVTPDSEQVRHLRLTAVYTASYTTDCSRYGWLRLRYDGQYTIAAVRQRRSNDEQVSIQQCYIVVIGDLHRRYL